MNWQCSKCKHLNHNIHLHLDNFIFEIDHLNGSVNKIPSCNICNENLRPNIQFKDDLDFLEDNYNI